MAVSTSSHRLQARRCCYRVSELKVSLVCDCRMGLASSKAADSDEDEDAPVVVGDDGVEELAIDDFRTQFPMAFGGQQK